MSYISLCLVVYFSLCVVDSSKDDKMYLMEVKLPTLEHRDEGAEIVYIRRYLSNSYGVDDKHLFKVIGEPRTLAVISVANPCKWERLTQMFVYMGEDFFVTSLYEGQHFCHDIGVNNSLIEEPSERFDNSNIYLIDVTFTMAMNSTYYKNTTKNIIENVLSKWPERSKLAFYKVLGQIPTRILFFTNLPPSKVDSLYVNFNCPEMCTMKVTPLQYLGRYVSDC